MSLTKAQLKERLGMITGSNAGTILGVNPYSSKYCMWATKRGRRVVDKFKGNNKTLLGTALETFCVQMYEQATGRKVRQVKKTFRHKQYPFIGGHIDGIVLGSDKQNGPRGLECKVVTPDGMGKWFDDYGNIVIPPYYRAQVLHYALITRRMTWDFSVIFTDGRHDHEIITIKFFKDDLDDYLKKCIEFWELVESGTPPPVDDSKATADALRNEWPTTQPGSVKVATHEVCDYMWTRQMHKEMKEAHESKVQLATNNYMNYMQDAETLISPSGVIMATSKLDKNSRVRNSFKTITEERFNGEPTTI